MTTFGKPQAEIVYKLFLDGHKPAIIAKATGIPEYRIKAIIKAAKSDAPLFKKVMDMKRTGMTDADIARAIGISKQHVQRMTGLKEDKVKRSKNLGSWVINMDRDEMERVMQIAEKFGLIYEDGHNSGRGHPRKLLEEIGRGRLIVEKDLVKKL